MTEKTKECSKCGENLPLSNFHQDLHKKDGVRPDCKKCRETIKQNNVVKNEIPVKKDNDPLTIKWANFKERFDQKKICDLDDSIEILNSQIRDAYKEFYFPSTNQFIVAHNAIKGRGIYKQDIAIIKAAVNIYLSSKKEKTGVSIVIERDKRDKHNILYNVKLPDDMILTCEEIDELMYTITEEGPSQLFGQFKIVVDDANIPFKKMFDIIKKYLSDNHGETCKRNFKFEMQKKKMIINLPKDCHIPKESIKELKKILQDFLLEVA
jgi:hypothetical protein